MSKVAKQDDWGGVRKRGNHAYCRGCGFQLDTVRPTDPKAGKKEKPKPEPRNLGMFDPAKVKARKAANKKRKDAVTAKLKEKLNARKAASTQPVEMPAAPPTQ